MTRPTAIMQLREQGRLRLDDPVSKYLPWFRVTRAEEDDPEITIEELLTHSSGLPREAGSHWTTFEFPTSEELRGLMADRQAPFSPEVRWKYSNLAFSVAVIVLTNADDAAPGGIATQLMNTAGEAVAKAEDPWARSCGSLKRTAASPACIPATATWNACDRCG